MLNDVSIDALHAAMRGLSARSKAISDDIANVNTPYFRSRSVAFEGDLKRALANGDSLDGVRPTTTYSSAPGNLAGNNVDLDAATVASVQTELSYQLALRAAGDRFTLTRTAIRGS